MEEIIIVSLQAVHYFSQLLSENTNRVSKNTIQYKIIEFISAYGNKNFIEIYNETVLEKKFEAALKTLNI